MAEGQGPAAALMMAQAYPGLFCAKKHAPAAFPTPGRMEILGYPPLYGGRTEAQTGHRALPAWFWFLRLFCPGRGGVEGLPALSLGRG